MGVSSSCWIDIGNQNISGNYTWCVFRGDITASGSSHNNYTKTGSGNFDGTSFNFSTTIPANTTKRMFDFGKDVYHDSDGNKYVSGSFSLNTGISAGTITGNAGRHLPTIPRASDITDWSNNTGYVDGTFTVNFTPKAPSYYYKIRISIPYVKQICKKEVGVRYAVQQNIPLTLTQDELNIIYDNVPDSSSCNIGIIVETYSDSGYTNCVGYSSELIKTMKLPSSLSPVLNNVSITGVNVYTTSDAQYYLQNKSRCKMTVGSVTLSRNATLKSYTYKYGGVSKSTKNTTFTTPAFTDTGDVELKITITDSRGMTGEYSSIISIYPYHLPIVKMNIYRCDKDKNRDDVGGEYIYFKPIFTLANIPNNEVKDRYVKIDGKIVSRVFDNETELCFGPYSVNEEHTIIYAIKDAFGSISRLTETIKTGSVPLNINKHKSGIAVGKYSVKDGVFEVGYTMDIQNGMQINGVNFFDLIFPKGYQMCVSDPNFNPNDKYPGTTWKRLKGVILGAIDETDSDTNVKTSFNQEAGTIIGSKYLQEHNHPFKNGSNTWLWGTEVGGTVYCPTEATAGGVPNGHNYLTTKQGVWNETEENGSGDAQNIQPTQLTYIWEKIS